MMCCYVPPLLNQDLMFQMPIRSSSIAQIPWVLHNFINCEVAWEDLINVPTPTFLPPPRKPYPQLQNDVLQRSHALQNWEAVFILPCMTSNCEDPEIFWGRLNPDILQRWVTISMPNYLREPFANF